MHSLELGEIAAPHYVYPLSVTLVKVRDEKLTHSFLDVPGQFKKVIREMTIGVTARPFTHRTVDF